MRAVVTMLTFLTASCVWSRGGSEMQWRTLADNGLSPGNISKPFVLRQHAERPPVQPFSDRMVLAAGYGEVPSSVESRAFFDQIVEGLYQYQKLELIRIVLESYTYDTALSQYVLLPEASREPLGEAFAFVAYGGLVSSGQHLVHTLRDLRPDLSTRERRHKLLTHISEVLSSVHASGVLGRDVVTNMPAIPGIDAEEADRLSSLS